MSARILIVDDEPEVLQILHSAVVEQGYEAVCAAGGEEALELFRSQPFDLVISDMKMPRMDGLELLRKIKQLDDSTEFIILTGFGTFENAIEALRENGAYDYLTKPLESPEVLELTIKKALERRFLQTENKLLLRQLKHARRELVRKVQEQEMLLDSVDTMIWYVTDAAWQGPVNAATAAFFGKTKSELSGKRLEEVLTEDEAAAAVAGNRQAFAARTRSRSEEWVTNARGEPRLLAITRTPRLDPQGEVEYVVCSAHDITDRNRMEEELRRSEARYRAVVEDQTELICRFRPDGTLTFVNDAFCRYFGKTEKELIGVQLMTLVADQDHEPLRQHLGSFGPEKTSATCEHSITRADGEIRWQEWTDRALLDGDSNIVEFQSVGRDITDRKLMQQELFKAQKLESLGILAGGIAHDFNNILGMILGYVSLALLDVPEGSEAQANLVGAEHAIAKAQEVVRQLLTFSVGDGPTKQRIWLAEPLREAVQFALSGSNIACEFHVAADLWPLECDRVQIAQVISSLAMNAREAMPEGGTLEIRAQNMTLPVPDSDPLRLGKYIRISLKDQGTGIAEENLPKIFDPFYSTKPRGVQKGMGLGLALVYSIVKKHDGWVTVDSRMGAGTTFHLHFPAAGEEIWAPAEADKTPLAPVGTGRVLVMEDDETLKTVVVAMLTRLGYQAAGCREGSQAVQLYTEAKEAGNGFDAVLLDLTVQDGMGGKETVRELLEIDPAVRALVTSGYSNDPVMAHFHLYGFSGALEKPCTIRELNEALQRILPSKTGHDA